MNDQVERRIELAYLDDRSSRLDKFIADQIDDLSRSQIQRLIREGYVTVDGETIRKTGYSLDAGSKINLLVPPPAPAEITPEDIPLSIIYEDDNLLIVNKPAGMVVHPSAGHDSGTLVHAVLSHAPEMEGVGGVVRPGVVHRLDKDTSGIIVLAKNDSAHRHLQAQFKNREVEKWYLALVDGAPPTEKGRIETPIGRDPSHRQRMSVVPPHKGREARTEYYTRKKFPEHTLLDVHLLTGRTHQIRVHLAFIGCPVVGDRVYGRRRESLPVGRQFLHSVRLTLTLPGESTPRTFEAPLTDDLQNILADLDQRDG